MVLFFNLVVFMSLFLCYFSMLYIVCLYHCMYVCYMFIKDQSINQHPVLWQMSYFHTIEPMARIKHDVLFRKKFVRLRYQLYVRQLQCLIEFIRTWHWGRSLPYMMDLLDLLQSQERPQANWKWYNSVLYCTIVHYHLLHRW